MTGRVTVVGVGPGRPDWCLPAVTERLLGATDLVGYGPYLDLVPPGVPGRRHPSDNRVEAERAGLALDLAAGGADVAVVSSGDPGIFAMGSAVLEAVDGGSGGDVPVEVLPGITAAQALASRVGAPLGHDFCVISLSDVLKPWDVIEARLAAAAGADFVVALYNPISRHRPWQLARAVEVLRGHRAGSTPVAVGRRIGRPGEQVRVVTLADLHSAEVDMSTVLIVGSSTTRWLAERPVASSLYTPRHYGS